MANAGVNKVQVKKARDALIAKGLNPSIDAVRVELGNTGSKATIHRYLKEISEESASSIGGKTSLSDTLNELVEGLAAQLHREAEEVIEHAKTIDRTTIATLQAKVSTGEQALLEAKRQIELMESQLISSEQNRLTSSTESQVLLLKVERLTQELHDKADQLATKDSHIASLEEKHQHSRLALEHYRESVKEQREQDLRRHETQIQQLQSELRQLNQAISIKQTDITQLNKDNSQLTTEVRELRKQLSAETRKVELFELQLKNNAEKLTIATHTALKMNEILKENEHMKTQFSQQTHSIKLLDMDLLSTKTELRVKSELLESLSSHLSQAVQAS